MFWLFFIECMGQGHTVLMIAVGMRHHGTCHADSVRLLVQGGAQTETKDTVRLFTSVEKIRCFLFLDC